MAQTGSSDQSWEIALAASKNIGYLPGAFGESIRMLLHDHSISGQNLRPVTKYQVARVLRSPNFKAVLYYGTKTMANELLAATPVITIGEMMELFQPMDIAMIISCSVLVRRTRKLTQETCWSKIRDSFARDTEYGSMLGVLLPSLSMTPGIIWGALPHVAHGLLSISDPKSYDKYLSLSKGGRGMNIKAEMDVWGCTSSQVISVVLSSLGFKKNFCEAISVAASTQTHVAEMAKGSDLQNLRLSLLWYNSLLMGREQPQEKLPIEFHPFQADKDRVLRYLSSLTEGSPCWLERNEGDISKQKTPQLFAEIPVDPELEIPDQLKEVFTLKQISDMDEWDFDTLVDHIEKEVAHAETGQMLSSTQIKELDTLA